MKNEDRARNDERKLSPEELKAAEAEGLAESERKVKWVLANRAALEAQGFGVDAWLKEMQEARADFLKSCEVCDDADEALRAAKAVCEAQLDKMRACIITGIEEWDSIIAAASGADQAQKRVELWEAFQAWKEEMREKLEASPHDEVRALLAMLDNGA